MNLLHTGWLAHFTQEHVLVGMHTLVSSEDMQVINDEF